MSRIDWNKIDKATKEKMLMDIIGEYIVPCEVGKCPMDKYKIDCDKDNDHHCACKDFLFSCTGESIAIIEHKPIIRQS